MRSFPPDVLIIDRDGLRAMRLHASGRQVKAESFNRAMFTEPCFDDSPTPVLTRPDILGDALDSIRRRRRIDSASVLAPDSWFRTRILELDSFPEKTSRQHEAVEWAMRRHSPSRPGESRIAWQLIERTGRNARILVIEANEEALQKLEEGFKSAGLRVVLIEPIALNIWNALTIRHAEDDAERVLVVAAHDDVTMIHCRGSRPDFIRARQIDSDRATRDIRLAATYLRENTRITRPEACWIVGDQLRDDTITALETELDATALRPDPRELGVDFSTIDGTASHSDLIAALGVFAA